ncbi:MAG: hypothetical protein HYX61_04545 [Gammaproteobacteria bacterium]|nr:hypothetical protein [Gammaproteobacteria bacterium]
MDIEQYLDEKAYSCLRDVADEDYICARMAFKAQCSINFHWLALQAIEKYIKCILLLRRKKAKFGHDLRKGLKKAKRLDLFHIDKDSIEFILYINKYGSPSARYLELATAISPPMLNKLDKAVWEIRRYCIKHVDSEHFRKVENIPILERNFSNFSLQRGYLERILSDNLHSVSKDALIWCNPYFGSTEKVKNIHFSGRNPPELYLSLQNIESQIEYLKELNRYC